MPTTVEANRSFLDQLALLPDDARKAILNDAEPALLAAIATRDWSVTARPKQRAPEGGWLGWVVRAGAGFGKTRTGSEWTWERIRWLRGELGAGNPVRWALVAPTFSDGRDTQVEGETGLLSVLPPSELPRGSVEEAWNRSIGELTLIDGSRLRVFSSEKPHRLRGPQHHGAWVDEYGWLKDAHLGMGEHTNTTISNLLVRLRLPPDPRVMLTGTPTPTRLVHELDKDPRFVTVVGSTYENVHNLAPAYLKTVVEPYEGTRLGDQELHGRILDDVGGVLHVGWFRRVRQGPEGSESWPAVRYWDLAATEPSAANPDPDWTASVLVHREPASVGEARYHIAHVTRLRGGPGDVEDAILAAHEADPKTVPYGIEQERGSAGAHTVAHYAKLLVGRRVIGNRPTGDKRTRVEQSLALSAQKDRVTLADAEWTQAFLDEVMIFTGDGSTHDDQVDATAGAWELLGGRVSASAGRSNFDVLMGTSR